MEKQTKDLKEIKLSKKALYNGIEIPEDWNFEIDRFSDDPVTPPYLISREAGGYAPDVINVDKGRQLFVDDFLTAQTSLSRTYHTPRLRGEPIFKAEMPWEVWSTATPVSGGVWYDQDDKLFKMWYSAGFCQRLAYATSKDGVHWERPALNQQGNNLILRDNVQVCSTTAWIDYDCDPVEKFKLMIRLRDVMVEPDKGGSLYTSPDGINWYYAGRTGTLDDRSTFFYNELTKKWVFSLRYNSKKVRPPKWSRFRVCHMGKSFREAATWKWSNEELWDGNENSTFFWQKTDSLDVKDPIWNEVPELYNFDAIDYESISVGMFQIWHGPEVKYLAETKKPKITELQATFSRDGVYYDRPVRGLGEQCFIPASRKEGTWDYGYVQSVSGALIVRDDELNLYYTAFSGKHTKPDGEVINEAHAGGSLGMATLRRDGFASMDGTGELLTKRLTVTKDVKYLFVNANAEGGSLKAEILDEQGNAISGYTVDDCVAMTQNSCCQSLTWNHADDLSFLQNKGFRIRFVQENCELYAFWLSNDEDGASGGATAAGYVKN